MLNIQCAIESVASRADGKNKNMKMSNSAKERIKRYPYTGFGKGNKSWNKGKKMSVEYCENLSRIRKSLPNRGQFKKGQLSNEKHHNWKGEDVGYDALHRWMARHYGEPEMCEWCTIKSKHGYEWAMKHGKRSRNREDWVRLCKSCHRKYDFTEERKEKAIKNLIWYKDKSI